MPDTGIDVHEVVNLVFLKKVHPRTKFWQMIGRDTRLCLDLCGSGQDNTDFLVLDFCSDLQGFGKEGSAGAETPLLGAAAGNEWWIDVTLPILPANPSPSTCTESRHPGERCPALHALRVSPEHHPDETADSPDAVVNGLAAGTTISANIAMMPTASSACSTPKWSPRKPSSDGPPRKAP